MLTDPRALLAAAAAAAPSLLAYNVSPSPTFLNQALALALWGGFVLLCAAAPVAARVRDALSLLIVLALLAAAALWSWGPGGLPASLALSALGLLCAAALLLVAGATQRASADA
ncbi:MAG: polymerase, partial [Rubrivivax sp.]|nr:polymerase [Rubrivivax sp.]